MARAYLLYSISHEWLSWYILGKNDGGIAMEERIITLTMLEDFRQQLINEERSPATIEKYLRDVQHFVCFTEGKMLSRQIILAYKAKLGEYYAVSSANSMLAAMNALLRYLGWEDLCIKQFKLQRQVYLPEEKELTRAEYERLVTTAHRQGNERLCLILQTICATGIRVSELPFITVEAAKAGEAIVRCKGKTRTVLLVKELRTLLLQYARAQGLSAGPVFITRSGRPVSRTAVWRDMKALCLTANVAPGKVFPHNLRHLFARTFYGVEKDIAKLADILGHSSIDTTRIYVATTGAEHRRRMESLHLAWQIKNPAPIAGVMYT